MPRVSIVLPVYNGSKYIRESLDSIVNQSYTDWELIIVNDCSTDNTLSIVEEYAIKDERINIISNEENQKLPKSLNIGFRLAKGEYLTWTSDDNIFMQNALQQMVSFLDEHDYVMVCARYDFISQDGEYLRTSDKYSNELMAVGNRVGACFLYKRSVIDEIGEYNSDMFLVEDYEYWLRIYLRYGEIGFLDKILYKYRMHSSSLTSTRYLDVQKSNARMKKKYLREIVEYLADKPEYLSRVYFHINHFIGMSFQEKELIRKYIDVLDIVVEDITKEKCIVYGAGNIGAMYFKKNEATVVFFADIDDKKVGNEYCKRKVLSIDQTVNLQEEYEIVVAAGIEKLYDILQGLKKAGLKRCYVYQEEW